MRITKYPGLRTRRFHHDWRGYPVIGDRYIAAINVIFDDGETKTIDFSEDQQDQARETYKWCRPGGRARPPAVDLQLTLVTSSDRANRIADQSRAARAAREDEARAAARRARDDARFMTERGV